MAREYGSSAVTVSTGLDSIDLHALIEETGRELAGVNALLEQR